EAVRPEAKRLGRDPECGLLREADAGPSGRRILPRKEGLDGAGMTDVVAVIKMVGAGVVEIHRLLDEAQPEHAGVEIEVAVRFPGNGRHVVNSRHAGRLLWE